MTSREHEQQSLLVQAKESSHVGKLLFLVLKQTDTQSVKDLTY